MRCSTPGKRAMHIPQGLLLGSRDVWLTAIAGSMMLEADHD
jgi:hypothetical protein